MMSRFNLVWAWVHALYEEDARRRRLAVLLGAMLLVLSVFPQPDLAVTSMTPMEPAAGLAPALGALGAVSSYMSGQNISEVQLRVARSVEVRKLVIDKLKLNEYWHSNNLAYLEYRLGNTVNVRTARGGILMIEVKGFDPDFAIKIVDAYGPAIQARLAELSQQQTQIKRRLLNDLMTDAYQKMKAAENRLDEFRRNNATPEPVSAFLEASTRLPALVEMRRSKEMQLAVLQQFQTNKSFEAQSVLAEISEIDRQIAAAKSPNAQSQIALDTVIPKTTELGYLIRDLEFARGLYVSYQKLMEGTSLEVLVSGLNLRVLEPAHIDPSLEFNWLPMGLLLALLLQEILIVVFRKR